MDSMSAHSTSFDPLPPPEDNESRILHAARHQLFGYGYSSFTMDDLAQELGMSKKTLYVHFSGKDAIVDRIVEYLGKGMSSRLDAITSDRRRSFVQKLCAVVDTVGSVMLKVSPGALRDLQRFAPSAHEKIDQLRQKYIPIFFARLIRAGIAEGKVRKEVNPDFAAQFWLQAIRGLLQPDVLDRNQLTPRQTLERAIDLFFGGLLTPAGRQDYAKHISDCGLHPDES